MASVTELVQIWCKLRGFSGAGVDECRVIDFPRYDAGWINNRQVLAAGLMGPVELHDTADGTS
jgi:hypothetical protein